MEKSNQISLKKSLPSINNNLLPIDKEFGLQVLKMKMDNIVQMQLENPPVSIKMHLKNNEEKTIDILQLMMIKFQDFYNCSSKMDKNQLLETAYLITHKVPHLNYYDIAMCFKLAKLNEKIYNRIDGAMILEWLINYDIDKTGRIVTERQNIKAQQDGEWTALSERSSIQKLRDYLS